jgi:hypothetical protein
MISVVLLSEVAPPFFESETLSGITQLPLPLPLPIKG